MARSLSEISGDRGATGPGADEDQEVPEDLPECDVEEFKSITGLWLTQIIFAKDLLTAGEMINRHALTQITEIAGGSQAIIDWV